MLDIKQVIDIYIVVCKLKHLHMTKYVSYCVIAQLDDLLGLVCSETYRTQDQHIP